MNEKCVSATAGHSYSIRLISVCEREESPPLELGELEAEKGLAEVEREVAGDQDLVVSPKCRG